MRISRFDRVISKSCSSSGIKKEREIQGSCPHPPACRSRSPAVLASPPASLSPSLGRETERDSLGRETEKISLCLPPEGGRSEGARARRGGEGQRNAHRRSVRAGKPRRMVARAHRGQRRTWDGSLGFCQAM